MVTINSPQSMYIDNSDSSTYTLDWTGSISGQNAYEIYYKLKSSSTWLTTGRIASTATTQDLRNLHDLTGVDFEEISYKVKLYYSISNAKGVLTGSDFSEVYTLIFNSGKTGTLKVKTTNKVNEYPLFDTINNDNVSVVNVGTRKAPLVDADSALGSNLKIQLSSGTKTVAASTGSFTDEVYPTGTEIGDWNQQVYKYEPYQSGGYKYTTYLSSYTALPRTQNYYRYYTYTSNYCAYNAYNYYTTYRTGPFQRDTTYVRQITGYGYNTFVRTAEYYYNRQRSTDTKAYYAGQYLSSYSTYGYVKMGYATRRNENYAQQAAYYARTPYGQVRSTKPSQTLYKYYYYSYQTQLQSYSADLGPDTFCYGQGAYGQAGSRGIYAQGVVTYYQGYMRGTSYLWYGSTANYSPYYKYYSYITYYRARQDATYQTSKYTNYGQYNQLNYYYNTNYYRTDVAARYYSYLNYAYRSYVSSYQNNPNYSYKSYYYTYLGGYNDKSYSYTYKTYA